MLRFGCLLDLFPLLFFIYFIGLFYYVLPLFQLGLGKLKNESDSNQSD